jgi:hypothetical protein
MMSQVIYKKFDYSLDSLCCISFWLIYFAAVIMFVFSLYQGLQDKYMHYPSLSELHYQSDRLNEFYIIKPRRHSDILLLKLASAQSYSIPTSFYPQLKSEIANGNKLDMWIKYGINPGIWQLKMNDNLIISREWTENHIKQRSQISFKMSAWSLFIACTAFLLSRFFKNRIMTTCYP